LRNLRMLADYLDKQRYRPGKFWASAISLTRLAAVPIVFFLADIQYRTLARRTVFLNPARFRIRADVDDRRALFPRAWRRCLFPGQADCWPRVVSSFAHSGDYSGTVRKHGLVVKRRFATIAVAR